MKKIRHAHTNDDDKNHGTQTCSRAQDHGQSGRGAFVVAREVR